MFVCLFIVRPRAHKQNKMFTLCCCPGKQLRLTVVRVLWDTVWFLVRTWGTWVTRGRTVGTTSPLSVAQHTWHIDYSPLSFTFTTSQLVCPPPLQTLTTNPSFSHSVCRLIRALFSHQQVQVAGHQLTCLCLLILTSTPTSNTYARHTNCSQPKLCRYTFFLCLRS